MKPASFGIFRKPEYKSYRKNWTAYPGKMYVSDFPLNLDIHVTNKCNLRCVMCRRTMEAKRGLIRGTGFLDFGLYKKIIDEAAKEGCCAVHLTGNGEPLLHKDIIGMISYARRKRILDVFMHTNATLLTQDIARQLLTAGLTRLIISFDSPVKETYEKIRKGAKFEAVKGNIEYLTRLKKELGLSYPLIRIQMVDMKVNRKEIARFNRSFENIVDSIGHISYINYRRLDKNDRAIKEKACRQDFRCEQLWQRLSIEWNGKVYACLVINKDFCLGSAAGNMIKRMWHGRFMKELRLQHKLGRSQEIEACRECGRQYKVVK